MNRWRANGGGRLVGAALAPFALVLTAGLYVGEQARVVGTGFFARTRSSGVFVSGRGADAVANDDLRVHPSALIMRHIRWSIDRNAGTASANWFGLARREVSHDPARGCVLGPVAPPSERLETTVVKPRFDLTLAAGDPRSTLTVEHALTMTTGLAFNETYVNPFGDVMRMLFIEGATAPYAAAKLLGHPPGEHWSYASGTTNILMQTLLAGRVPG